MHISLFQPVRLHRRLPTYSRSIQERITKRKCEFLRLGTMEGEEMLTFGL